MSLKQGYGEKTLHDNYIELLKGGKMKQGQCWAAALEKAREGYFKAHPKGVLPMYLALRCGGRSRKAWEDSKHGT